MVSRHHYNSVTHYIVPFKFEYNIVKRCCGLLPLEMCDLKFVAVSSYRPCLGSGILGGSGSVWGSWGEMGKDKIRTSDILELHLDHVPAKSAFKIKHKNMFLFIQIF